MIKIPTYDQMMNPLLKSINELGGSGSISEINEKIFEIMKLDDEILEIMHNEKSSNTEIEYRLAWTRTYLKKYGILENSSRGIWALTQKGKEVKEVNSDGSPPIDLIDGDLLINKLKEYSLGLKNEIVEKIEIDKNWYKSL